MASFLKKCETKFQQAAEAAEETVNLRHPSDVGEETSNVRHASGEAKRKGKGNGLLWLIAILAVAVLCTYLPTGEIVSRVVSGTATATTEKVLPIYSVETDKKVVALSFDAAWGNEDTQQILDTLKKYDVKVTFFMTGGWMEKFPDDVKKIQEAGHDLGNHSENHKNMSQLSATEIASELQEPHKKIKELTGVEMDLFRPPYGDYDNEVVNTAKSCGYYTVQWDVDSLDWKDYGVDSIVNTVVNHKNLQNGSIILMHNGAKYTAQALPAVSEGLQKKGYELVPISELIIRENYHIDHTGRQIADEEETSTTKKDSE